MLEREKSIFWTKKTPSKHICAYDPVVLKSTMNKNFAKYHKVE